MNKLFEISHKGHTNDNNGNTKQSIINAINLNYDMIEIDIQLCKTGEIILHHDIYIGDKYVYESTYDEITNIDKSIVQLSDVLTIITLYNKPIYFDLKGKGPIAYNLIKLLDSMNINYSNMWMGSFNYNHLIDLIIFRNDNRCYKLGLITSNNFSFNVLYEIKYNLDFIAIDWQIVNNKFIEECHSYNILLFVYTCKNTDELKFICKNINSDGIITNITPFLI